MASTKVIRCDCTQAVAVSVKCAGGKRDVRPKFQQRVLPTAGAEFQDKTYGKGNRLHNAVFNKINGRLKLKGWACTICTKVKEGSED